MCGICLLGMQTLTANPAQEALALDAPKEEISLEKTSEALCQWPAVQTENRPGSRWWWLGSVVNPAGVTWNMESLKNVGIGSVEITPIYGIQGKESEEIPYLTPQWMTIYDHVVSEGKRLNMIVDMNNGTGWPFGGPAIETKNAATRQLMQTYAVQAEKKGRKYMPQSLTIRMADPKQQDVAVLSRLLFVHADGSREQLPLSLVNNEVLTFTPQSDGHLYALFNGKTKQKVKRAAPGGEGWVMNHLSKESLNTYLQDFDKAFAVSKSPWPHTFFNDSYEVYGADWSENLLDEFKSRRGYDLADYLPEFQGIGNPDSIARVVCDYRNTIGDMLLDNFTIPWTEWAHSHGSTTRNQAHGSPGNLLDLYAAVDIPECESFGGTAFKFTHLRVDTNLRRNEASPATLKYASSAAHVTGKPYTSSESMTWLTEHFRTALSHIKPEMDLLFLNGVNRVFYHGTPYTSPDAPWPGWLFYASILVNPNNTIFRDMKFLNTYITRIQSFMQQGEPDNELLLYFPIYDIWEKYRKGNYVAFDIHKMGDKIPEFEPLVYALRDAGYDLDYISDRQLQKTRTQGRLLQTQGGGLYKTILVPYCEVMPVETLEKLLSLAKEGAQVLFLGRLPQDVPGLNLYARRREALKQLWKTTALSSDKASVCKHGKGRLAYDKDLLPLLSRVEDLTCESLSAVHGIDWTRRKLEDGRVYFVAMHENRDVEAWVELGIPARTVLIFDPQTGRCGKTAIRQENGKTQMYLQLKAAQSLIIRTYTDKELEAGAYAWYEKTTFPAKMAKKWDLLAADNAADRSEGLLLHGDWTFRFTEDVSMRLGDVAYDASAAFDAQEGPVYQMSQAKPWTELETEAAKDFSGTGVYTYRFVLPKKIAADEWLLDFTRLAESARIRINGQEVGAVWCVPYEITVGKYLLPGKENVLEIAVTNLPANRISDYDRRHVNWRIFKDINIVSVFYKPITFDVWNTQASGLLYDVKLIPLKKKQL